MALKRNGEDLKHRKMAKSWFTTCVYVLCGGQVEVVSPLINSRFTGHVKAINLDNN